MGVDETLIGLIRFHFSERTVDFEEEDEKLTKLISSKVAESCFWPHYGISITTKC